MATVAGVDEAGKGPVIGPMVVAGVAVAEDNLPRLVNLGVRDSKLHTPRQRERLAAEIKSFASSHEVVISAAEIDLRRRMQTMNEMAVETFALVLDALRPDRAIVDAPDVDAGRFARHLAAVLPYPILVRAEHHADANHPVVSAASIVAKVRRDAEIERLKRAVGVDFGSGYCHDPKTVEFVRLAVESGNVPDCVRGSWATVKELRCWLEQRCLDEFGDDV